MKWIHNLVLILFVSSISCKTKNRFESISEPMTTEAPPMVIEVKKKLKIGSKLKDGILNMISSGSKDFEEDMICFAQTSKGYALYFCKEAELSKNHVRLNRDFLQFEGKYLMDADKFPVGKIEDDELTELCTDSYGDNCTLIGYPKLSESPKVRKSDTNCNAQIQYGLSLSYPSNHKQKSRQLIPAPPAPCFEQMLRWCARNFSKVDIPRHCFDDSNPWCPEDEIKPENACY